MSPLILVAALMVAPVLVLVLLRVNAALVFLSLCLGDVLVQFIGKDVVSLVLGSSVGMHTTTSIIKLVLLLAPAALTTLFMIRTVHSKQKIFNVLPAIGVGSLTALLVVPLLSPGLYHSITRTALWGNIQSFQASIVAASTVVCLLFLWLQRPKAPEKKSKHKG